MTIKNESTIKIGLGVWVCFCVLISLWVFTRFTRGKQQLSRNLHVLEDSIRKMEEKFELDQRKKSMGYVETLDDVTACLDQEVKGSEQNQDAEGEGEDQQQLVTSENEFCKVGEEDSSAEAVEDKKHI